MQDDARQKPGVLVVEDHPVVGRTLAMYLASHAQVFIATTLREAVEYLHDETLSIHGLILDVTLPDGSCLALMESMRDAISEMPTVVMTGDLDVKTINVAAENGALFIGKPFNLKAFDHFLERCCARAMRYSPSAEVASSIALSRAAEAECMRVNLSPRQREVLRLHLAGLDRVAISEELGVSPHTYDNHVKELLRKTGTDTMIALMFRIVTAANVALAREALRTPLEG